MSTLGCPKAVHAATNGPAGSELVAGGTIQGNDPEATFPLSECSYVPKVPQLIRRSLKRSLDMFVGNVGLPRSHYAKFGPMLGEFRLKHARIKLHDEFAACLDDNPISDTCLRAVDVPPPFGSARDRIRSTTVALVSRSGDDRAAAAAPPPVTTSSALLKRRGGPLEHLTFKKTVNIPAPVRHAKWELKRVIAGHHGWVRTIAVDPATNEWFASSGNDRLIKIWDLATGSLRLSLTGHVNTVRAMTISNRRPYLFSAGEDQMVKCWDLEQNKVVRHYHGHLSGVYCLDLHPTLDILATGGRDAVVRLWDVRTKRPIHVFAGHAATVMSLRARESEPQLISGSLDKTMRCWDLVAGRSSAVLTHHKKAIRALAVHPNEQTLCSAGADYIKLWNLPAVTYERNLESQGVILNALAIRANDDNAKSSLVVAGSDAGHLCFWDWTSGRCVQTIETIPQPGSLSCERAIYALVFDMSQTRVLTGECDKTIKVWAEKVDEEK